MVDAAVIQGGPAGAGAKALKDCEHRLGAALHPEAGLRCEVFETSGRFGNSRWPFTLARPEAVDYDRRAVPRARSSALDRVLVLPWNESYTEEHVDYIADSLKQRGRVAVERGEGDERRSCGSAWSGPARSPRRTARPLRHRGVHEPGRASPTCVPAAAEHAGRGASAARRFTSYTMRWRDGVDARRRRRLHAAVTPRRICTHFLQRRRPVLCEKPLSRRLRRAPAR